MSRANLRKAGSYAGQSDAILAKVSPHRLALKLAVKYFRGFYVELIRDAAGNPTLLDSRPKHGGHTVTRAFVPPKLHGSLEALLTLPTQPASCGSTADFFKEICEEFSNYDFSDDSAKLFAYYTIAAWLVGALPIVAMPCYCWTSTRGAACPAAPRRPRTSRLIYRRD
jgi:hypothetical protein